MEGQFPGEGSSEQNEPSPHEVFGWWNEIHGADGLGFSDFDDPDDLESTAPLPLAPDDRLWRHPSELSLLDEPEPPKRPATRLLLGVALATGCLGATIGASAMLAFGSGRTVERVVERELVAPVTRFASTSATAIDVVAIADQARPSIVRVEVRDETGPIIGSGSGVVFRDDGHILTNAHVITEGSTVEVVTHDGRTLPAVLVGKDTLTDIAVLRVEDALTPITLGSTGSTRVGEPAVAIGSPLRLEGGPTVTLGVVSAMGRSLARPDSLWLYDLVQTDAPISPGSSGGALLDANGALIGITTVIAVSNVGAEGLGFATPVEIAHDVAVDLINDGRARHGFLGVGGEDLRAERADELGITGGSVVTSIGEDSPAEQAGVQAGDLIVSVDGASVESMAALVVLIRRSEPGQNVELHVIRDGERLTVEVELTERPEEG
ncbi:MAG: PDZ domain-containing protein [Actinomycetia bacterium]|nr:PDZ domain-containing protein [Actinomycetes bacterium]